MSEKKRICDYCSKIIDPQKMKMSKLINPITDLPKEYFFCNDDCKNIYPESVRLTTIAIRNIKELLGDVEIDKIEII